MASVTDTDANFTVLVRYMCTFLILSSAKALSKNVRKKQKKSYLEGFIFIDWLTVTLVVTVTLVGAKKLHTIRQILNSGVVT